MQKDGMELLEYLGIDTEMLTHARLDFRPQQHVTVTCTYSIYDSNLEAAAFGLKRDDDQVMKFKLIQI